MTNTTSVTPVTPADLAERKALLITRAEFDRVRLSLLGHDVRDRVSPRRLIGERAKRPATIAAAVVGLGVPLLGPARLSRWLRTASMAAAAWRIVRNWRGLDR
jgi:hypothetical protein